MKKALYLENSARPKKNEACTEPVLIVCYAESVVIEALGIEIVLEFEELDKLMEMVKNERTG